MAEPLRFMGIPISKPLFGIYWLLTNAQVELLMTDVSIIVSGHDKPKGKKDFKKPSVRDIEEAANRWKDKYKDGATVINIDEYIPQAQ